MIKSIQMSFFRSIDEAKRLINRTPTGELPSLKKKLIDIKTDTKCELKRKFENLADLEEKIDKLEKQMSCRMSLLELESANNVCYFF